MLAIADHAWKDGTNAWPSVERLSKMTGLDQETVRRSVKKAESLGELKVDRKKGGRAPKGQHASNDYILTMVQPPQGEGVTDTQPPQGEGVNPRNERVLTPATRGGNRKVTKKEPTASNNEADAVCRKWWEESNPKPMPAGGFVGARKIIAKALDAGWSPDELSKALPMVDTLAFWSLEKALKQNKQELVPNKGGSWW